MKRVFSSILTLTLVVGVILSSIILFRTLLGKSGSGLISAKKLNLPEAGNSNGNLLNYGIVVQKGEYIYYANERLLCKIKVDGSNRTILHKLDGGCYEFINVVGSWIYYQLSSSEEIDNFTHNLIPHRNIYKIKIDGTHETAVTSYTDEDSYEDAYMNVVGDWIYFMNHTDGDKLYKIKIDGSRKIKLINHYVGGVNVVGGWIYYQDVCHGNCIYKMRIDGSKKIKVGNKCSTGYLNIAGNWIYYTDANRHICKVSTDGSIRKRLNQDTVSEINVSDGWIYYANVWPKVGLWKMKIDGTNKKRLSNDEATDINIAGNWIYYKNISNQFKLYRIKTDGTGRMAVN